jgi:hypothetical protein
LTHVFLALNAFASNDVGQDPSGEDKKERKQFFFEKKNQKTFTH